MCKVGLAEALDDDEVLTVEDELTPTMLFVVEDVFEVEEVELRTLLVEIFEDEITDELDLTTVEDFEELLEVVEAMLETPDTFDVIDEEAKLRELETAVESKYNSSRFPAPQYS